MGYGSTRAELEAYRNQGFFVRNRVFAEAELEHMRAAVEEIHQRINLEADRGAAPVERVDSRRYQELLGSTIKWEWAEGSRQIRSMEPFHHLHSDLDLLIDDPRLWEPTLQLIGAESVSLFTDKLNFKRANGAPFPWHQDTPYWAFGCDHLDRLAGLQIYLDDASTENGCLWVIPSSHLHGMLPPQGDRGVLGKLYTDIGELKGEPPLPIEASAGSVLFFDGNIVHGSKSNRSTQSRRALVITYQPPGLPRWRCEEARVRVAERVSAS
jgi:phytanoyl-CoA hydroxylase